MRSASNSAVVLLLLLAPGGLSVFSTAKSSMYPSWRSTRASSRFIRDAGTTTCSRSAWIAFRMRVRKSATGSFKGTPALLPGGLRHARDHSLMGDLAQADAAQAELAVVGPRAAAPATAIVVACLVLASALLADFL